MNESGGGPSPPPLTPQKKKALYLDSRAFVSKLLPLCASSMDFRVRVEHSEQIVF